MFEVIDNKVKKTILIVLMVIMATMLSINAYADSSEYYGNCGDNVYYSYDRSTCKLLINGHGKMYNYFKAPWLSFKGIIKSVNIGDGVTSIGSDAFYGCEALTSITIPDNVTSIGDCAFSSCEALTSITIPSSVTSIGNNAFSDCTTLKSITIPNIVTSIGDGAFSRCYALASITIPSSVTSIGDSAFHGCDALKSIIVDKKNTNFKSIDSILFSKDGDGMKLYGYPQGKTATSYTIPTNVTSIGDKAFYDCGKLTSIEIPSSVASIGNYAFAWCYALKSITIPSSVTSIGNKAFSGCTALTSITIPSNVTSIGNEAFFGCTALKSITIPSSVTSIGDEAFALCKSLTSITIPSSVTSIGNNAFYNCTKLTSVTYLGNADLESDKVFAGCYKLVQVKVPYNYSGSFFCGRKIFGAQNPSASPEIIKGNCGKNVMYSLNKSTGTLTILGDGEMNNYLPSTTPWESYKNDIKSVEVKDGVTSICIHAFLGCSNLKVIKFSDGKTIGF